LPDSPIYTPEYSFIKNAEEKLNKYKDDQGLQKLLGNTQIIRLILLFSGVEFKYYKIY